MFLIEKKRVFDVSLVSTFILSDLNDVFAFKDINHARIKSVNITVLAKNVFLWVSSENPALDSVWQKTNYFGGKHRLLFE